MRLEGKLAVITAAASGMGRAGVELFCREGAKVCAIDLNADALAAMAGDMAAKGTPIETVQADLSTVEAVNASIDTAAGKLGGIDILWAHAGIPGPSGIEDLDIEAYRQAMALNVDTAVFGAGRVARYMRKRGAGSIIFTASASGLVGSRFSPVYSTAKFGVVGLAKSLAQTYAPDGIRVNVLCPGLADTPMGFDFTNRNNNAEEAAANKAAVIAAVPLGRLVKAEEVAHAALWLASDDSGFVTGIDLPVDGGYTCR